MGKPWVVLANSARARIFERDAHSGDLLEVLDLVHPQSREKAADLVTDHEGHAQKAHGDRGHRSTAFEPRTGLHRQQLGAFAQELGRHLEKSVVQGICSELTIFASDPFLGEFKKHLGHGTRRVLGAAIPRDLSAVYGPELVRRVTAGLEETRGVHGLA